MNKSNDLSLLLNTINEFENVITRQLKPLNLSYQQVLCLLNLKQHKQLNEQEQFFLHELIKRQLISSSGLELTEKCEEQLKLALEKLKIFEARLFSAQEKQNSLLNQLNKIFNTKL